MKTVLTLLCIPCLWWCLCGCEPIQSHSEIPEIHFKSLSFDSITTALGPTKKAVLVFSFIDGDGDLGVRPIDTIRVETRISKIYYTWYVKMPDKTYKIYQFEDGTTTSSEIPWGSVMNKEEAQNKVLKGTIQIALDPPFKPEGVDTMRIEYYIVDRARHTSNVDQTPDFSIINPPTVPKSN